MLGAHTYNNNNNNNTFESLARTLLEATQCMNKIFFNSVRFPSFASRLHFIGGKSA